MTNMTNIRNWQFEQLRKSVQIVGYLVQSTPDEDIRTVRDRGTGWTVLEVLCHLHDYEAVFTERAKLTLDKSKSFPTLPNPDQDQLAIDNKYNEQDVKAVFADWAHLRSEFVHLLETVEEDDWDRAANHPNRGWYSLTDQLMGVVWHDNNHIAQMTTILEQKASS